MWEEAACQRVSLYSAVLNALVRITSQGNSQVVTIRLHWGLGRYAGDIEKTIR